jgi:hypothetical protein
LYRVVLVLVVAMTMAMVRMCWADATSHKLPPIARDLSSSAEANAHGMSFQDAHAALVDTGREHAFLLLRCTPNLLRSSVAAMAMATILPVFEVGGGRRSQTQGYQWFQNPAKRKLQYVKLGIYYSI